MEGLMWFFGTLGGLNVAFVLGFSEFQLRMLADLRRVDVTLRTIPGEPPPSVSRFDALLAIWRMLQWLTIGVILLLACASLALKGT